MLQPRGGKLDCADVEEVGGGGPTQQVSGKLSRGASDEVKSGVGLQGRVRPLHGKQLMVEHPPEEENMERVILALWNSPLSNPSKNDFF
jgi:hypothetical protein